MADLNKFWRIVRKLERGQELDRSERQEFNTLGRELQRLFMGLGNKGEANRVKGIITRYRRGMRPRQVPTKPEYFSIAEDVLT